MNQQVQKIAETLDTVGSQLALMDTRLGAISDKTNIMSKVLRVSFEHLFCAPVVLITHCCVTSS
jgi:hypothetical protein